VVHTSGPMNVQCSKCNALHFLEEQTSVSSHINPRFSNCCLRGGGGRTLPTVGVNPSFPLLESLLKRDRPKLVKFVENLRHINNIFSFTLLGIKSDPTTWGPRGIYNLCITGELIHLMGTVLLQPGKLVKFAQIYTLDNDSAVDVRMGHLGVEQAIIQDIWTRIMANNPYAQTFKHISEQYQARPNAIAFCLRAVQRPGTDVKDHRHSRSFHGQLSSHFLSSCTLYTNLCSFHASLCRVHTHSFVCALVSGTIYPLPM
jgi:hypothetical protein